MTINLVRDPGMSRSLYEFSVAGDVLGLGGGPAVTLVHQVSLLTGRMMNKTTERELVIGETTEHSEAELCEFESLEPGSQLLETVIEP